jgi:hypothetical protein
VTGAPGAAASAGGLAGGARSRRVCHQCAKSDGTEGPLLQCVTCQRYGHAACWDLAPDVFARASTYAWQCMEDKVRRRDGAHAIAYLRVCAALLGAGVSVWHCPWGLGVRVCVCLPGCALIDVHGVPRPRP